MKKDKTMIALQNVELDTLTSRIYTIRKMQVMIDQDIARLYGVETRVLKQAVRRNRERFPADFMIELTKEECRTSQIVIFGDNPVKEVKYAPYAFTESGVAMLSGVLRSKQAVQANILIMRAFSQMRNFLLSSAGMAQRIGNVELKLVETDKKLDTVFAALSRGNLLPEGIIPSGSEYDAWRFATRLIESAKKSIVLIDPYSDARTLDALTKKEKGVAVRLICRRRNDLTPAEIERFNSQYSGLTVEHSDKFHDRFLIIDNKELFHIGASLNYLGRRLFAYSKMDSSGISRLLADI